MKPENLWSLQIAKIMLNSVIKISDWLIISFLFKLCQSCPTKQFNLFLSERYILWSASQILSTLLWFLCISAVECSSCEYFTRYEICNSNWYRGVFRTQSNIHDRASLQKVVHGFQWLTIFKEEPHHRFLTWF